MLQPRSQPHAAARHAGLADRYSACLRAFPLLLLAFSLALLLVPLPASAQPPLALRLNADRPAYQLGDPVTVSVRIDNVGGSVQTVSAFAPGNLTIAALTRDGTAVAPEVRVVDFDESPFLRRVETLTTLDPGESVEIPFDVETVGTDGYQVYTVELREEGDHELLLYPLDGPGVYRLQVRYRYTGPDGGRPAVFRGELISNELELRIGANVE